MRFAVRYIHAGGQAVVEETAEAPSEAELRARLVAAGSVVLDLRAASGQGAPRLRRGFDVAWWCRELRTLLRAGMTAVEAIETLAAGHHDAERDRVHGALLKALREGQSLSRAMRGIGAFPEVLVASVTASERTSTLPDALEDYLRYDEMLGRLRRQAVSAAIYPAVVIGMGVLIAAFLLMFVIPRFSRMYVDFHGTVSPATQVVLWLSRALSAHLPVVVALFAALGGLCAYAWQRGWVARGLVRIVEGVEPLRRQWDHFRLAKLFQSLALMFKGGYTLDEALQVCQGLDLGRRMGEGLATARREIARGKTASSALASAGLTETVTERLLAVGERTGSFESVLQTIADRHAQAFATFVERATRIVEPLLLLMVALVVGGIVVMMYMPIFDIAGGIGGS
ncbi:MAG TPA: type II secretion system F family protein [Albitalea sp.]|uniref:type II secretion system F family protein n=1 Tax=Piscinibacter sp. TaxID=1903157 RepID=UPI002ED5C1CC